jgi:hypothetical protein
LGPYYQQTTNLFDAGSRGADVAGFYHFTTLTNQLKETNSVVDVGLHYLALDDSGNPIDSDADGLSDYLEDVNGNGLADPGESDWTDFYNASAPLLAVVNGNGQQGMPNTVLPVPLVVSVAAADLTPSLTHP